MNTSLQDLNTYCMWAKRIPGYVAMKRDSKRRAKVAWKKKMNTDQTHPNYRLNNFSLDTCIEVTGVTAAKMPMEDFNRAREVLSAAQYKRLKGATIQKYVDWALQQEEEKENTMSTISVNTNDRQEQQVRYLRDRLERLFFRKDLKAKRLFGMVDDESPKTAKDLVERIKSDNFVITKSVEELEDYEDYEGSYYTAIAHIKWRSPDKKRDPEGYKTWSEANQEIYDRVKDAIFVLEPAEGLKTLQEYEDAPIQ